MESLIINVKGQNETAVFISCYTVQCSVKKKYMVNDEKDIQRWGRTTPPTLPSSTNPYSMCKPQPQSVDLALQEALGNSQV